ncbi:hypothetical protein [Sphingomonas sp. R86520]|uniref:hypothetical protein n=1 Tax=Sphingomonas sp. R86520 TaxID=3093859 RepID=UPI0036D2A1AD
MTARTLNPVDPAWRGKEQRHAVRIVVDWAASVAADKSDARNAKITDCTNRGCRIETDLAVAVGTFVHVAVPQFADVTGWVAWSSAEAIGVDFSHPLPGKILEYIIDQTDPF